MANTAIIGLQYGDEGKGKNVDALIRKLKGKRLVVRFQGSNNAGHTIYVGDVKKVLHHLPAGIFVPDVDNYVGRGCLVSAEDFLDEYDDLSNDGTPMSKLFISDRLILKWRYHKRLDEFNEFRRGNSSIGTTKKGVGPGYADFYSRKGLTFAMAAEMSKEELINWIKVKDFDVKYESEKFSNMYDIISNNPLDPEAEVKAFFKFKEKFEFVNADTFMINEGGMYDNVIYEGAQAAGLDIATGNYPMVTSSYCCTSGIMSGCGVSVQNLNENLEVIGIMKAYCTRVGGGPFPTEIKEDEEELQKHFWEVGKEFGATTGRPRRPGWLDLVQVKKDMKLNGVTSVFLTKIDIFTNIPGGKIKVCTSYEVDGERTKEFPRTLKGIKNCKAVYTEFDTWTEDISGIRRYDDLPQKAKTYLNFLEDQLGVKLDCISVSPSANGAIYTNKYIERSGNVTE